MDARNAEAAAVISARKAFTAAGWQAARWSAGHIDPTWLDSSIEDMASAYARLIIETQPEGPYHLLGWSFGADLAIDYIETDRVPAARAFRGALPGYRAIARLNRLVREAAGFRLAGESPNDASQVRSRSRSS